MAAATADRLLTFRGMSLPIEQITAIKTSDTVYIGCMLNLVTTTGRVCDATAAASRTFAGVCTGYQNTSGSIITAITGNTGGTIAARYIKGECEVLFNIGTATRTFTNLRRTVTVKTNQDIGGTGVGTTAVRVTVGTLSDFISLSDKTQGWIRIDGTAGFAAAT